MIMPEADNQYDELKKRCNDLEVENFKLKQAINQISFNPENNSDSELRYQSYFEQSPDGILIINPEDLSFFEFNNQACEQLGYTREEFSKLTLNDIEAAETSKETEQKVKELLEKGRSDFDTKHRSKSGKIRYVKVSAKTVKISG